MTEEKKEKDRYILTEVPTQTALVIQDLEKEQIYSGEAILLEILNKLNKIEKAVG